MNTNRKSMLTADERTARDTERRSQLDSALMNGVQAILDSDTFQAALAANAKFHAYSANNAMLIWLQNPAAQRVAGFHTWRKLGRTVKKGEKGIMIYAPRVASKIDAATGDEQTHVYFGIEHVFDVSQTEGDDIPTLDCPILTEERGHEIYDCLVAYATREGLTVSNDDQHAMGEAMGYYSASSRLIWIRPAAKAQMVKTLIHEIAHHLTVGKHTREADETIAEGTAYQVCACLGIDSSDRSFTYIAGWAAHEGGTALIKQVLGHIQTITKQIMAIVAPAEEASDGAPEPPPPTAASVKRRRTMTAMAA
ncbi:ArdC-like ssDNA-binding domain-containing protein [Herpetosiphon geysericola]|uniref:ArdC-like ssDNA-binding domain-containing protein n=1 Tax=Herpetosiphon geysericola TaxID=70996 RepID=UPI0006C90297|nr:ArdC-like ssDNA-binding domain-containing protein [Herpetosiphon geysericola]